MEEKKIRGQEETIQNTAMISQNNEKILLRLKETCLLDTSVRQSANAGVKTQVEYNDDNNCNN